MKIFKLSNTVDSTGFSKSGKLTSDELELFLILKTIVSVKTPNTSVYVAGGWTRDKLLGLQPKDIDLVVDNMDATAFAEMVTQY